MANLDGDLDKPGVAPGGDQHFTSSTLAWTSLPVTIALRTVAVFALSAIRSFVPEDVDRNGPSIITAIDRLACRRRHVRMAFGDNLPPYILVDSSSGIEVDIVREALAYRGHVLEPVFNYLYAE